jgi:hypothetical protein
MTSAKGHTTPKVTLSEFDSKQTTLCITNNFLVSAPRLLIIGHTLVQPQYLLLEGRQQNRKLLRSIHTLQDLRVIGAQNQPRQFWTFLVGLGRLLQPKEERSAAG